jgi:hypothetical protein
LVIVFHAARWTARHGVGSCAVPPAMECVVPVMKSTARQYPAAAGDRS